MAMPQMICQCHIHPNCRACAEVSMELKSEVPERDLVEGVYNYLTKASYPHSASHNEKRVIRTKAKKFCEGW